MTPTTIRIAAVALVATAACTDAPDTRGADGASLATADSAAASAPTGLPRAVTMEEGERHLTNVRQLTDGGENA